MTRFLVSVAKAKGCKFVTLSASSDSGYCIYKRFDFGKIGPFECFECKSYITFKNIFELTHPALQIQGLRLWHECLSHS